MKNLTRNLVFCGLLAAWPALAQPPQTTIIERKPNQVPELPTLPTISWKELSAQIGGPTLVTLSAAQMSGAEAFDALVAPVPLAFNLQNRERWDNVKNTVTADYRAQPFWVAALDMGQQLGGEFREFGNQGVTFAPGRNQKRGAIYNAGPGVFTLQRATYLRSVEQDAADNDAKESLSIACAFYGDPKLQWQNNSAFVELEDARDEQNQSLISNGKWRISGGTICSFPIALKPPLGRGGKLKLLRGNFHGVVAAQSVNWEVANVLQAKNVEKILKSGDSTTRLELQDVVAEKDGFLATVVVSQSGSQLQQLAQLADGQRVYLRNEVRADKLHLLDDQNRELRVRAVRTRQEGDDQTRITTLSVGFALNRVDDKDQHSGAPVKFAMRYDADWRELVVPFEFSNVILP